MRKDFEEIEKRFRSDSEVLAVFHAARFSFEGEGSFVLSNSLLQVFLGFGFVVDLLRRVNPDHSVDTYAVVSADKHKLEELSLLSCITARALGIGEYLIVRKGCVYKVNGEHVEAVGCSDRFCPASFLDAESYTNPFSFILPLRGKLRKGDYIAVTKAVERLAG